MLLGLHEEMLLILAIGAFLIYRNRAKLFARMPTRSTTDFSGGVPGWFWLGVAAWIAIVSAGIVVRIDRPKLIAEQELLGEQSRIEQQRREEAKRAERERILREENARQAAQLRWPRSCVQKFRVSK